jgi:hypothetical protein
MSAYERTVEVLVSAAEDLIRAKSGLKQFENSKDWKGLGTVAGNTLKAAAKFAGLKAAAVTGSTIQSVGRAARLTVKTAVSLPETVNGLLIMLERAQEEAAMHGTLEGSEMILSGIDKLTRRVRKEESPKEEHPEEYVQQPADQTLQAESA